jgi:AcrR family transcriptional regulator
MPESFLDSVWMRPPRARVGQPTLSREQIVRAAIELLDADGPAGLSMRRLGTKLGSGATSLYWHVAHKEELLELAVDQVLGEVYVPEPGDTSWRIGMSVCTTGVRDTLLRHPWVIALLGTHPTMGPNAMRLGDRMVAVLVAAGFTAMEVSHASGLLHAYAIGAATTHSAAITAIRRSGQTPRDLMKKMEPYLDEIGPDHPNYDKWLRENDVLSRDPEQIMEEGFAFGLERLLDGLALWLAARKPGQPPAAEPVAPGSTG